MQFSHHPDIWARFPELAASTLYADGIHAGVSVAPQVERFNGIARARLAAAGAESELPEIKAWRGVFSRMGLKPTQYRCASESLLRRFRKEGALPPIHPLIDLCNAASLAYAIPVAALDVAKIAWPLQVRPAAGTENYLSFADGIEHPEPGEVTFADSEGRAHARRWTHRQSGLSAIRVFLVPWASRVDDTARIGEPVRCAILIHGYGPGFAARRVHTHHRPHGAEGVCRAGEGRPVRSPVELLEDALPLHGANHLPGFDIAELDALLGEARDLFAIRAPGGPGQLAIFDRIAAVGGGDGELSHPPPRVMLHLHRERNTAVQNAPAVR